MKALLVAEPGRHALLEQVLRGRGHGLSVMSPGDDAVQAQAREQFPLLFVDVSSSASSGAQQAAVLELLARHGDDAAVVALVDEERPGELRSALAAGATDWLKKTSTREALEARIALVERQVAHFERDSSLRTQLGVAEADRARLGANLHTLLDASPDPIAVHRDFRIVYGNPAATQSFRFASPEEMVGYPIFDLIHPEDHDEVLARIRRVLETGQPAELREERFRARDGAELVGEAYSFRLQFKGELAVMTVGRDLTEPRQLQTQLFHSERLATIGAMTAAIAHELKNPLTYVICNLADLCRKLPGLANALPSATLTGLEARVDAALEGVERLRAIAQDLSQFTRLKEEDSKALELRPVLESVLRMASPELHGLDVKMELEPMPAVRANEVRLSQVFLNLIINAAQAVRESPREPRSVRVQGSTDGDGWAVVAVQDTGVGIAPELLPRVFDAFYTTKKAGTGTGLGLSVAQTIVKRLRGELSVTSEPGVHTTFRVRLPPANEPS